MTVDELRAPSSDDPYPGNAADEYNRYHRDSARTRLTTRREIAILKNALRVAGDNLTALDLPCGAGRFWPAFDDTTSLIAADVSQGMLRVAETNRLTDRIPQRLICTSAFDIDLPDNAVRFAVCMRFLHHVSMREDRLRALRELRRVASEYVAISLWVDGNLGALRRMRRSPVKSTPGFGKRICRPRAEAEEEFRQAGFEIVTHYDVWPKLSMWRLYLLRPAIG